MSHRNCQVSESPLLLSTRKREQEQLFPNMYLLDTTTFTHHYFAEPNVPDYAILSHRWDETEVSFAEIFSGKDCQKLPGFPKIRGCCSQARLDGWGYVWIDSCCIDKSSSAELSEAIKSMFLWYSQAQVCYVYLSDVPVTVANGQPSFELDEMELLCAPSTTYRFVNASGSPGDGYSRSFWRQNLWSF